MTGKGTETKRKRGPGRPESPLTADELRLASNLAALRRSRGMTQRDLEMALGAGINVVSRWEQGKRRITTPLQRVAKVLGCSVADLVGPPVAAPTSPAGELDFQVKPGTAEQDDLSARRKPRGPR